MKCVFECPLDILTSGECDCDADVGIVLGSAMRPGEEDRFDQNRVPVIARQRMREVNQFGIDVDLDFITDLLPFPSRMAHTSGEARTDIGNMDNLADPMRLVPERALECLLHMGRCTLNQLSILMSELSVTGIPGGVCSATSLGGFIDDHFDGIYDEKLACAFRYYNGQVCFDDIGNYINSVCEKQAFFEGVGNYDWATDINNVGFTQLEYDMSNGPLRSEDSSGGDNRNTLSGPTVSVVGVKTADKINGIQGLGIGNTYDITAIARAQVYYVRNPNRTDEKPSTFNPYWVARLAPIDSEETPVVLKDGLPYISSMGIPVAPTH